MFELGLLLAGGAAVVCFLKGQAMKGIIALLLMIGAATFAFVIQSGGGILLLPVVVIAAIALAWGRAEPGSYWDRHSAVDATTPRPIEGQPMSQRVVRAVYGGLLGLAPGVLLIVGVGVAGNIFNWSGDTMQIAFVGIPIGFFGMIGGVLIGLNWVPRTKEERDTDREASRSK